jgi:hypothetical protein
MLAQVMVSPNASPTLNSGGWVYGMAILMVALGVLIVALVVFGYLRFAPRFRREEAGPRPVRAPRLVPGAEAPRRPVNVTAAPVVVPAPALVAPAPAAVSVAAAAAPAAAPPPAPAAAPEATSAPAAAPTPVASEAPAVVAPAPAAPPAPTPAPAGAKHEIALDQETFDTVLAELIAKGTDRRVAEGQARRAAMIAARKKAGG